MKKGDIVIVNKSYSVAESGKINVKNTKNQARTIAAIYDDGRVLDNVGDVWQVKPDGVNRWLAVS